MEKTQSTQPASTELSDKDLDLVSGGAFRWIRAIFHSGTSTGDTSTSTNPQAWVTSAT